MWQLLSGATIHWAILAVGVIAGAIAGRRKGKWALIGVFCVVWVILVGEALFSDLRSAPQLLEFNSPARIFADLWPPATVSVALVLIPMLLVLKRGSSRKLMAWGVGSATLVTFALPVVLVIAAYNIPSRHDPCNLPALESSIPSRTIAEVRTTGFFSNTCPVPVATEMEFHREYGVIRMHWWGDPHRLYMLAQTPDGQPLSISGGRVESYTSRRPDSFLAEYTSRVTFSQGHYYIPAQRPLPVESFAINISGADGDLLEQIELRYVPQRCTCANYDVP